MADAAQAQAAGLARLAGDAATTAVEPRAQALDRCRDASAELQSAIQQMYLGLDADAILVQRRALATITGAESTATSAMLRTALDDSLRQSGIDPSDDTAEQTLQQRSAAARKLIAAALPVNLAAVALQWAAEQSPQALSLPQRLSVAAQLERVRADGDPTRATDLQLASRAAWRIEQAFAEENPPRNLRDSRAAFAAALSSLLRSATDDPASEAATARIALRAWGGESATPATQRANLSRRGGTRSRGAAQSVASGTDGLASPARPATQPSDLSWDQALRVIRRSQEELTELPQMLGRLEQLAAWAMQTNELADQVQRDANAAAPDQQRVSARAVAAAVMQADEAFDGLTQAGATISRQRILESLRELTAAAPETATLMGRVELELIPALDQLQLAIDDRDPSGVLEAIAEARKAVVAAQENFRRARMLLVQRDPLVAARWFADRAAAATRPTSSESASAPSAESGDVGANGRNARIAASDRLPAASTTQPAANRFRASPWRQEDLNPAMRRMDPPGFQQSLQTYFRMLGIEEAEEQP
jgi:hypothetical protein